MSNFEFGYAQADITPAYGLPLCGYFNPRPNKGAYDRLHVKAAVFRTGDSYAGLVSYDLRFMTRPLIDRFDQALADSNSPLAGKVLFCATSAVCLQFA